MSDPLRVLLVDDEELARLRLRSLVGECESPRADVVGEASNAAQALAWLAEHDCDLLLLDIGMPGMSSASAATIRRSAARSACVTGLASAFSDWPTSAVS